MTPTPGLLLAHVDALPDPGAIVVDFADGEKRLSLIVTRRGAHVTAFFNRCPHAGYPLERPDGRMVVQEGRYRNTTWHRVVPNFVAQDGDIGGADGLSPDFMLRESVSRVRHERGCLGLATAGRDTGGSQYYLCHSSQPHLDGGYTVFGRVVAGWDVMDRIVQGDRMREIRSP